MGKPITDSMYARFHVGRSWAGHPLEDACKCIKAPCGLVGDEDPECDQHGVFANKTMRQIHRADQCPGPDVTEGLRIEAAQPAPLDELTEYGFCGSLSWTVERWGRVTHKHSCPNRTDPWCQSHPTTCALAIGGLR